MVDVGLLGDRHPGYAVLAHLEAVVADRLLVQGAILEARQVAGVGGRGEALPDDGELVPEPDRIGCTCSSFE